MPEPLRLIRKMPLAMAEDAWRRLTRLAAETGMAEGGAHSFLLEHLDSIVNPDTYAPRLRLRLFLAELAARKA